MTKVVKISRESYEKPLKKSCWPVYVIGITCHLSILLPTMLSKRDEYFLHVNGRLLKLPLLSYGSNGKNKLLNNYA